MIEKLLEAFLKIIIECIFLFLRSFFVYIIIIAFKNEIGFTLTFWQCFIFLVIFSFVETWNPSDKG